MSIASAMLGRLVAGVEPDKEETSLADEHQKPIVRVYLDARYKRRFVLAAGSDAQRLLSAWGGNSRHIFLDVPPGTPVYEDATPLSTHSRSEEEK